MEHTHERFPEYLAFLLSNPIRRFLQSPEQLIAKLDVTSNDVVVDFGCGPGFYAIPLAKVARKVIGVDVSPEILEKAVNHAQRNGVHVEFLKSDGTNIRLENGSVDVILLVHVFHEVENKPRVLSEFLRILKSQGRLVVVERTRGSRIFSGKLGPPTVSETVIVQEIARAGFTIAKTIPHRKDSIITGRK
jgi:ubiquinone/menaquinone biosynthesis C-methylase UbiE